MSVTDYEIEVVFDLVRYRVRFQLDKGRILDFVVQLELKRSGVWAPVVRYDTAHGFAHRDRHLPDGSVRQHELLPYSDYNGALTYALEDVRNNWPQWIGGWGVQVP